MDIRIKRILVLFLLCLSLLLVGCLTPIAQANQAPQWNRYRPSLPAPLKVVSAQRLYNSKPDTRYPPADFGRSFALGDGVLAIGAPSVTSGEEFSAPGSVYVYRRGADGWVEETKLVASNQDDGIQKATHFGMSLAIQDQALLVGAPDADNAQVGNNSGAVYVFKSGPDGWKEIAILKSPQPAAEAKFGYALAIDGNNLCVLEGQPLQGSRLRLFQGNGDQWSQTALIEAPAQDGWQGGIGGFDIYGDTLALSFIYRQGEEVQTKLSGKTLLYQFDGVTWTPTREMPNVIANQLALDGQGPLANRLAVASIWDSLYGMGLGMVTVYTRQGNDWILEDTLSSPDSGSGLYWDSIGGAVAMQGDLLVAGAPMVSEDALWDGVAYLYQRHEGRWVDQLRLTPIEDGGQGDFFGSAAIYGNTVLISAPDEFGNAAYVYEIGAR